LQGVFKLNGVILPQHQLLLLKKLGFLSKDFKKNPGIAFGGAILCGGRLLSEQGEFAIKIKKIIPSRLFASLGNGFSQTMGGISISCGSNNGRKKFYKRGGCIDGLYRHQHFSLNNFFGEKGTLIKW